MNIISKLKKIMFEEKVEAPVEDEVIVESPEAVLEPVDGPLPELPTEAEMEAEAPTEAPAVKGVVHSDSIDKCGSNC